MVNDKLERMWNEVVLWPILSTIPAFCLEGLRKTRENLSQNSWCSGHDVNQTPPKCKSEGLSFSPFA
jgi:hypothetical protein